MRTKLILLALFSLIALVANPIQAKADYFNYPCNYPFVGTGGDVNVIVDAGGQYCDGPTEINWTHYHCQVISANVNIGAFAFAGQGPLTLGGLGGNGMGGKIFDCHYLCPDGSIGPFPNPPAAWTKHLVLQEKYDDCVGHMGIQGPSSTPLPNQLPGNTQPGDDPPDNVAVPNGPGELPPGVVNPSAPPNVEPPPAAPTEPPESDGDAKPFTENPISVP